MCRLKKDIKNYLSSVEFFNKKKRHSFEAKPSCRTSAVAGFFTLSESESWPPASIVYVTPLTSCYHITFNLRIVWKRSCNRTIIQTSDVTKLYFDQRTVMNQKNNKVKMIEFGGHRFGTRVHLIIWMHFSPGGDTMRRWVNFARSLCNQFSKPLAMAKRRNKLRIWCNWNFWLELER